MENYKLYARESVYVFLKKKKTKYIIGEKRFLEGKGRDDDRVSEKETTMPIISQVVRPIPIALSLKTSSFLVLPPIPTPRVLSTELYVVYLVWIPSHLCSREYNLWQPLRQGIRKICLIVESSLSRLGEELNVYSFSDHDNPHYIPLLNIIKKKRYSIFPYIIITFNCILLLTSFVFFSPNNFTLRQNTTVKLHLETAWTSTCPQLPLHTPFSSKIRTNFDGSNVKYLLGRIITIIRKNLLRNFVPRLTRRRKKRNREGERGRVCTNCARGNAPPRLVTRGGLAVISAAWSHLSVSIPRIPVDVTSSRRGV